MIVALALLSALATFSVLANLVPVVSSSEIVLGLFSVNGILIAILLVLVGNEVFRLVRARKAGLAASGITEVSDVFHIDRGYDDLVGRLAGLGASISRISGSPS